MFLSMLSIVLAIIIRTSLTILPKSSVNPIHIGILCAMPEELGSTLKNLAPKFSEEEFVSL